MCYVESMEYYYSVIKKEKEKELNLAICDNINGPRGYYAKGIC